jgi:chorismate mutase
LLAEAIDMAQIVQEITIQVPADVAAAYHQSSIADRQQLAMRIGAILRRSLTSEVGSYAQLQKTMDKLATEAQQNGLTPEILASILQDD